MSKYPSVAQMIELNKEFDEKILLIVDKKLICTSNSVKRVGRS